MKRMICIVLTFAVVITLHSIAWSLSSDLQDIPTKDEEAPAGEFVTRGVPNDQSVGITFAPNAGFTLAYTNGANVVLNAVINEGDCSMLFSCLDSNNVRVGFPMLLRNRGSIYATVSCPFPGWRIFVRCGSSCSTCALSYVP